MLGVLGVIKQGLYQRIGLGSSPFRRMRLYFMTKRCFNMLHKAMLSLGLLLVSLAAWAQPSPATMANMQFEIAKNFQAASEAYESLLASGQLSTEDEIKAMRRLADCYRLTNQPAKAATYYGRLKQKHSSALTGRDHFHYGYVLQMQGKYDEARQEYNNYRMLSKSKEADYFYKEVIDFAKKQRASTSDFEVRKEKVSSAADDYSISFYGGELLFVSKKILSGNVPTGGGVVLNHLFKAKRASDGSLFDSQEMLNSNGQSYTDIVQILADGPRKNFYHATGAIQDGSRHISAAFASLDLFETDYTGDGKVGMRNETPILFGSEDGYKIGFPAISPDGKTLVVAASKDGAPFNLYQLQLNDFGEWVNPTKLALNTPENEVSPFIDANNVLYYSSDGGAGLGGLDVFAAAYDAQAKTWKNPGNLGVGVNSSYDDLYFIWDAKFQKGYFSSNREGSTGGLDLYRASPKTGDGVAVTTPVEPKPNPDRGGSKPNDGRTEIIPTPPSSGAGEVVPSPSTKGNVYYGVLHNQKTGRPLADANVWIAEVGTVGQRKYTKTNEYGEYAFQLEKYTEYNVSCSKREFESVVFNVNTRAGKQRVLFGLRELKPEDNPMISFGEENEQDELNEVALGGSRSLAADAEYRMGRQAELPEKGYRIQLGLFSSVGPEVKQRLAPFKRYGLLLPEQRGDKTLYSLGLYAERPHAESALAKVKQQADFKDAFIRTEDLNILTPRSRAAEVQRVIYPKEQGASNSAMVNEGAPTPQNIEYRLGTVSELPDEGYFLQLGAYKDLDAPTKADLNDLQRYAKVFPVQRGSLTAYRLGLFASREHAEQVKAKLQNTRFKEAYMGTEPIKKGSAGQQTLYTNRVVYPKEAIGSKSWILDSQPLDNNRPANFIVDGSGSTGAPRSWANNELANAKPEEELPEQAKVRSPSGVAYKVQLGAFSRPDDFDKSRFEEIGYVETQTKAAGLTYFYLASYASVDAARAASRQAEAKGINNPMVVAYLNGQRISLQKAMAMDQ